MYAYTQNNPVMYVDPNGTEIITILVVVVVLAIVAIGSAYLFTDWTYSKGKRVELEYHNDEQFYSDIDKMVDNRVLSKKARKNLRKSIEEYYKVNDLYNKYDVTAPSMEVYNQMEEDMQKEMLNIVFDELSFSWTNNDISTIKRVCNYSLGDCDGVQFSNYYYQEILRRGFD